MSDTYPSDLHRAYGVTEQPAEDGYVEQEIFEWAPNLLTSGDVAVMHRGRLVLRGTLLNKFPHRWRRFRIRYQEPNGNFRVNSMFGPAREWDDSGFMVGRLNWYLARRLR